MMDSIFRGMGLMAGAFLFWVGFFAAIYYLGRAIRVTSDYIRSWRK